VKGGVGAFRKREQHVQGLGGVMFEVMGSHPEDSKHSKEEENDGT